MSDPNQDPTTSEPVDPNETPAERQQREKREREQRERQGKSGKSE